MQSLRVVGMKTCSLTNAERLYNVHLGVYKIVKKRRVSSLSSDWLRTEGVQNSRKVVLKLQA